MREAVERIRRQERGERRNQALLSCLLALLSALLAGCWDRVEIEERGFVSGVAVDLPRNEEAAQRWEAETEGKPQGKQRFVLTNQYVIPSALSGSGQGKGREGSATTKAVFNLSSEGDSLFEIVQMNATRASRSPFYEHMKVLIISDAVARSGQLGNVLDFFLRDNEMRKSIKVMISEGEAREILRVSPDNEPIPTDYIDSISENRQRTARMVKPAKIGDLLERLLADQSYALPRIVCGEDEVKIAGAAVIRGQQNQLAGFLGEEETEGLNFLRGEVNGGLIKVQVRDNLIVYEIKEVKRRLEANVTDRERMQFTVQMEIEGNVAESLETLNYTEQEVVKLIERKVAEEVRRLTEGTRQKLQEEFHVDAIGLNAFLNASHYSLWQAIKEDWDRGEDYFSRSQIDVKVTAKVRTTGNSIVTEKPERLQTQ